MHTLVTNPKKKVNPYALTLRALPFISAAFKGVSLVGALWLTVVSWGHAGLWMQPDLGGPMGFVYLVVMVVSFVAGFVFTIFSVTWLVDDLPRHYRRWKYELERKAESFNHIED